MNKVLLKGKKIVAGAVLVMMTLCLVAPAISAKTVKYEGYSIDRIGKRTPGYRSYTKVTGYSGSGYALNLTAGAAIYGYELYQKPGVGTAQVYSGYAGKFNASHCFGVGGGQVDYYGTLWYEN